MTETNESSPAWGEHFTRPALPTDPDIAAIQQAMDAMPKESVRARVAQLVRLGLLKDFQGLFEAPAADTGTIHDCRIADLGELVEKLDTIWTAIRGSNGADPGAPGSELELRLRDCRIDQADLTSQEIGFAFHLDHCRFSSPAKFVGTQFQKTARFLGASFLAEANFFAAGFAAEAVFSGACFQGPADFRGATFCGEVSFFRANFADSLELKFARFEKSATLNVLELRFRGSSVLGGSLSLGSEQIRQGLIVGENSSDLRSLAHACEQYGELEANFAAQGSPDSTGSRDWCHYRYMDLRRRTSFGRWSPRRLFDWLFLKWCFGYGVYTRRSLVTALAAIVLFGLLYATNGLGLSEDVWSVQYGDGSQTLMSNPSCWQRLGNSLYFSAITFATVGYGDWHPLRWARLAAAIEGISGVFIMAVFTVSFARKILR